MNNKDLFERVDKLLELNPEHPSYSHYASKYLDYINNNQHSIGLDKANELMTKIPQKLFRISQDRELILRMALKDLEVVRRMKPIKLNRLPISSYVFARIICADYLKHVKPSAFVDPVNKYLMANKVFYKNALKDLFLKMKNSEDYYIYYNKFRSVLRKYLINGILEPKDIEPYIKVVEFFEKEVEEIDNYLGLVDEEGLEIKEMKKFGSNNFYANKHGSISRKLFLLLMKEGDNLILKLHNSEDEVEKDTSKLLLDFSNALPEDPIVDFLYDKDHNTQSIYCRLRYEIVSSQKLAQSILNLYSPELLLQTALSAYFDIKLYEGIKYDKDSVLDSIISNLNLLQENGIIALDTQNKYIEQIKSSIWFC